MQSICFSSYNIPSNTTSHRSKFSHSFTPNHTSSKWKCSCSKPSTNANPNISRRQSLNILSKISVVTLISQRLLVPTVSVANALEDDEIVFTKLPCESTDCRPVEIHDYRIGNGAIVESGCTVVFRWTGRLADRYGWPIQKEDAEPVTFVLGRDRLIRGFEQAILGMREGGKRRMLIPAELGYQDEKSGPLPVSFGDRRRLFATVLNSRRFKRAGDLVIDVQLLKVRRR